MISFWFLLMLNVIFVFWLYCCVDIFFNLNCEIVVGYWFFDVLEIVGSG